MSRDGPRWRAATLTDLVRLKRGHDLPTPKRRPGNVPVMGSAGISGTHDESRASGPGLVVGRSGASFGKVHFCPDDYWPLNTALYATDFNGNDPRFAYYALKVLDLARFNSGSAQPSLNRNFIADVPISLPPLEEQREIAAILGGLDDKIANNRRLTETLEEVAECQFRARFVNFLDSGDLVESDLGPIPRGFEAKRLKTVVRTVLGGTPSRRRDDYWTSGSVPWINSGRVNDFRILEPTALITPEALEHSSAKLMPSGSTVLAITGATLGQVSRLEIEASANQSVIGAVGNEQLPNEYLYFWLRHRMPSLLSRQTGAAQQHINKGDVESLLTLVPTRQAVDEFMAAVKPLFDLIAGLLFESQALRQVRDSLLPRLISGEVRSTRGPASSAGVA